MGSETQKTVDWRELLRRHQAVSETFGEEDPAKILAERARALATAPPAETDDAESMDVLQFELSGESYAVAASFVSEIFPLTQFTPLFCTPPFVVGVTNLRGKIVSIIDLRRFFDLPVVGLSDLNRVLLVKEGAMEFGILADSISGMTSFRLAELQQPPAAFTGIREEFLAGVTAERVALLDLATILADPRLVVREEVE